MGNALKNGIHSFAVIDFVKQISALVEDFESGTAFVAALYLLL
jgi:hypothetical protein